MIFFAAVIFCWYPVVIVWGGTLIESMDSYFTSNIDAIVGSAMGVGAIVTLMYAGFGLRKYLSGDGRSEKELVKVAVGAVVFLVLLSAGLLVFFGRGLNS